MAVLLFSEKLTQAILTIKARSEALAQAKDANEKAISELNDLISKRLKNKEIESDKAKKLRILEINQDPLASLTLDSGEKLNSNSVFIKELSKKYVDQFAELDLPDEVKKSKDAKDAKDAKAKEAKAKEAPAAASGTPASK